ncbi:hypothetical protein [Lysobacter sp. CA199]|uniref:hypothetical protein n=1 Tax=Lysobacter sp. CA199 TaxID=3455608 RepID=UPI003F8D018F
MSMEIVSRPMTDEEKRTLAASVRFPIARFRWTIWIALGRAGLIAAALILVLVNVLWFGRDWLPSCADGCSQWLGPLQLIVLTAVVCATSEILLGLWPRWLDRERIRAARADLRAAVIDEEHYRFSGCECFVHADGERVMQLLRIDPSRCLEVYDYGEVGGDPADDRMLPLLWPRVGAVQRRAPRSRTVLSIAFEGAELAFVPQYDVPSRGWPPDRAVWEVPWGEVRRRLMSAGGLTAADVARALRLRDHPNRSESTRSESRGPI